MNAIEMSNTDMTQVVGSSNELYALQQTLYTSKNPTRRWLHRSRRAVVVDAIEQWGQATRGRALEVGPGSGVYLPVLTRAATEVVASDIEDAYLSQLLPLAATRPNLRLQCDDITRSSFASASFDLVLCSEVIEHIADSGSALQEMFRLLRPGGLLILTTPQRHSPLEMVAKLAFLPGVIDVVRRIYGEPILRTGHINLLTEHEARLQLEDAGFRIEAHQKTGVYLPVAAEALGETGLRLARRLEGRLRGSRSDWLLWTQYYVARKPVHRPEVDWRDTPVRPARHRRRLVVTPGPRV
jgi:2-polyprenyl-3-methyl-5-hydroxy-6-metoxy-1,4-benzoquinol methylase